MWKSGYVSAIASSTFVAFDNIFPNATSSVRPRVGFPAAVENGDIRLWKTGKECDFPQFGCGEMNRLFHRCGENFLHNDKSVRDGARKCGWNVAPGALSTKHPHEIRRFPTDRRDGGNDKNDYGVKKIGVSTVSTPSTGITSGIHELCWLCWFSYARPRQSKKTDAPCPHAVVVLFPQHRYWIAGIQLTVP